jgi:pantothenate kinase
MDKRQYKNAIIKVGIDGGGKFLKICLSLLQKNENNMTVA